jgi:DinB superfamily
MEIRKQIGEDLVGEVTTRTMKRLGGLTDDEYLWEPVADCWTVRPSGDGRWIPDAGPTGSPFTDAAPAPFTTIAWRMWHVGASPNAPWPPLHAPDGPAFVHAYMNPSRDSDAVPDAATAVALVEKHWNAFAERIMRFTDAELDAPLGPAAGLYEEAPLVGLLLHIVDELIHHAAEIAVIRDLYAHRPLT